VYGGLEKQAAKMSAATFVYVIGGDHGRQKIGVSDDPGRRLAELQTGSPFPLKFEFVALTEGTGFDIEGEAHFLLSKHRQSGEWFTVPAEVAITAVMAAARQKGHSIKPVDPDNIPAVGMPSIGVPPWQKWLKAAVALAGVYPMILLILRFEGGELPALAFAIEEGALLLVVKISQWALVAVAGVYVSLFNWLMDLMAPGTRTDNF
jgi:hypothetical protein